MIDLIRSCRRVVTELHCRVRRLRTNSISRADIKAEVTGVVDGYFQDDRRLLLEGLSDSQLLEIDDNMRQLLQFTHSRTPRSKYLSTLKRLEKLWRRVELEAVEIPGREVRSNPPYEYAPIVSQNGADERPQVFIGHGRSREWLVLAQFLQERLDLGIQEFNRDVAAGKSNVQRLQEMLDRATFAFLILSADDLKSTGSRSARLNVVHELGLFQGRLGFERAIVLLEDECEEFSNIEGLTQLRFPHARLDAVFEDVRRVLERERVVTSHPSVPGIAC